MYFIKNNILKIPKYLLKRSTITQQYILHKYKRIIAFTLAEILLVLLIIGIVASLVIPALIHDTQNAELKTALKTFYGSFSNATKLIANDNGGSVKGVFTDGNVMRDLYAKKMNIIKKCNSNETPGNCWHKSIQGLVLSYNGTVRSDYNNPFPAFILSSGAMFIVKGTMPNCDGQYSGLTTPVSCALIRVDINGFKGPNRFGYDVFDFHVLSTSVSPRGGQYDSDHSCSIGGDYCAGAILSNG